MDLLHLPFAHVGHWILYALYALPVLIVLASIVGSLGRGSRDCD